MNIKHRFIKNNDYKYFCIEDRETNKVSPFNSRRVRDRKLREVREDEDRLKAFVWLDKGTANAFYTLD